MELLMKHLLSVSMNLNELEILNQRSLSLQSLIKTELLIFLNENIVIKHLKKVII